MSENPDNSHDNAIGLFFVALIVAGLVYLIWYFFDTEIRNAIRWIRYTEMWVISWFVSDDYTVLFNGAPINWQEGFENTKEFSAAQIKGEHLSYFTALAAKPIRIFLAALMGLGALWCVFKGPRTHNRRSLGLEGLIEFQSKNFPVITPFLSFNPSKQPPRPPGSPVPAELPLFAEALGPEEWLAYFQIKTPDGKVDEKSAEKAFKRQLIGRWKGVKALKPYQQILFAAFCLKASRKRDRSDDILGRIAQCWSAEKGLQLRKDPKLLNEAKKIIANKDLSAKTISAANKHAYVTTAMLRALQFAREEGGVLAPAQFVWLRGHDRTLWYPMNNLGRQSFHTEAIGAMSHFKAERLTQRPIPTPKVENAVDTITDYMSSIDARPIPQLDYKGTQKRAIKQAT